MLLAHRTRIDANAALGGKPNTVAFHKRVNANAYQDPVWLDADGNAWPCTIRRHAHAQPFANLARAYGRYFARRRAGGAWPGLATAQQWPGTTTRASRRLFAAILALSLPATAYAVNIVALSAAPERQWIRAANAQTTAAGGTTVSRRRWMPARRATGRARTGPDVGRRCACCDMVPGRRRASGGRRVRRKQARKHGESWKQGPTKS